MATKEEILDSIAGMTVLELSELLKEFEEKFGVTAAAPVAAAAQRRPAVARCRSRRGGAGRVRRHPDRRRRQEDPGHQGGAVADQPGPEGGQGPGRRRSQGGPGEGQQGRGRARPRRSSREPAPASSSSKADRSARSSGRGAVRRASRVAPGAGTVTCGGALSRSVRPGWMSAEPGPAGTLQNALPESGVLILLRTGAEEFRHLTLTCSCRRLLPLPCSPVLRSSIR